jgi:hypothetical protein
MKNRICSALYNILYKLDTIKKYDYETAPYCGHHYNGHHGKYTISSYHEGIGYKEAVLWGVWVHLNSEENDWRWGIVKSKYNNQ